MIDAFDNLLVKSVRKTIIKNLGGDVDALLDELINQNRQQGKNNSEFELMCEALGHYFGDGRDGVITTALQSICSVDGRLDNEGTWFTIHDVEFMEKITDAFLDDDSKKIIDITSPVPLTAEEVVSLVSSISPERILKKINHLLSDNIITLVMSDNGERRYKSIVIKAELVRDNNLRMSLLLDANSKNSFLLKLIS